MITGFNTDIEFDGVTYHVQTEDKGLGSPVILSLVYHRGTVLASKRLSYGDLVNNSFDENELAARLQKQHRLMCAAVQAGRIEDLKRMTQRESGALSVSATKNGDAPKKTKSRNGKPAAKSVHTAVFEAAHDENPIPIPTFDAGPPAILRPDEPVMVPAEELDEYFMIPDEAVEIISETHARGRPVNNKLSIEFLGDTRFRGGDSKSVGFMVCRGSERKVVSQAQIMVKILGSSFRPLIFHALTDDNGVAKVNLELPTFTSGRAALLVRAISNGEEIELRRNVSPC